MYSVAFGLLDLGLASAWNMLHTVGWRKLSISCFSGWARYNGALQGKSRCQLSTEFISVQICGLATQPASVAEIPGCATRFHMFYLQLLPAYNLYVGCKDIQTIAPT